MRLRVLSAELLLSALAIHSHASEPQPRGLFIDSILLPLPLLVDASFEVPGLSETYLFFQDKMETIPATPTGTVVLSDPTTTIQCDALWKR